jgi:hypothetical protein
MRHLRLRRHQVYGEGWAILNDRAHNYQLLTYYTAPDIQAADLRATGFRLDEALDDNGVSIDINAATTAKFIHYAATTVALPASAVHESSRAAA